MLALLGVVGTDILRSGSMEVVFAHGQVYVLWSRVTIPKLFKAVRNRPQIF